MSRSELRVLCRHVRWSSTAPGSEQGTAEGLESMQFRTQVWVVPTEKHNEGCKHVFK